MQDIALEVDDVAAAFEATTRRGAVGVAPPTLLEDEHGVYEFATIRAYGDTTHSFVNRDRYRGVFAPGFKPLDPDRYSPRTFHPVGLKAIDHIVGNVEEGKMDEWVEFYENVLGFSQLVHFDDKDISTEYSALMSKVVQDGTRPDQVPDQRAGQGPAAVADRGIPPVLRRPGRAAHRHGHRRHRRDRPRHAAQRRLVPPRAAGLLRAAARARRRRSTRTCDELAELGILVDRDDEGYLLQIFTKPVEDRPTLFFEIIERHGARSFGKGNFKALFEAIEREQERRGTL